eukprot:COSAG01_NODE_75117_length_198_cov_37.292929_2_plen_35_part_01
MASRVTELFLDFFFERDFLLEGSPIIDFHPETVTA